MGITINRNTIDDGLRDFDDDVAEAVKIMLNYWAARAITQMRLEARWTDRTTNARNGLNAQVFDEGDGGATLVLYHSVPYGIWLEVRWSGRYAIVGPTLNNIAPQVMRSIADGIGRL